MSEYRKDVFAYLFSIPVALGLSALIREGMFPGWPAGLAGWIGGALAVPLTYLLAAIMRSRP